MFGHVSTDARLRGLYYLFYTYDSISGGAVLAALVAGDAAVEFEAKPEAQAVVEVLQLLRGVFEPQGVTVPQPLQVSAAKSAAVCADTRLLGVHGSGDGCSASDGN